MKSLFNRTDRPALRIPREVSALITALQLNAPDLTLLETLSNEEWTSLLTFSDLAHLTLSLALLPNDGFPSWVVERLRTNIADNARRFEHVQATYSEAARALHDAGVEHIVIKGFTQSPDYVKDPRNRSQSDIDLYCPEEKIERAQIALQAIGYKPDGGVDGRADHAPALVRLGGWTWRGNPFDPEMPLSIELHFCLWNRGRLLFNVPGVSSFWERRITRDVDGFSFPCLSPADQLGYLALHILRNILSPTWIIHHVRELAAFLHSHANDDAFWRNWHETHNPTLQSLEAITFYYARAWFGCDLHPRAEDEIANLPTVQQRWLHRFIGSALEGMFHQNKDSVWLHWSLLQSPTAKRVLLKRFLLPYRIPPINSPAVSIKNRRSRSSSGSHRYSQYVAYLFSTFTSFNYLNFATILRGLRWRFSQHQLIRQFWIFLAASFFLTWACPYTSSSSIFS